MSDHPREAERNLKRINICNDVWYNIFGWSGRVDLGLKIAPICARFDGLADVHLRTIRWTLVGIGFQRAKKRRHAILFKSGQKSRAILEKSTLLSCHLNFFFGRKQIRKNGITLQESALLDVPPPSNLIGFEKIEINYVHHSVIAFLHRLHRLFNSVDTCLALPTSGAKNNTLRLIVTHIWPRISPRLHKVFFFTDDFFIRLRTLVSATVLRDCANLRVIRAWKLFPDTMAASNLADSSAGQALSMWLHSPRSDGRPKVLRCVCFSKDIVLKLEGLKKAFVRADLPARFIIFVESRLKLNVQPFECENIRTRERMTFQRADSEYRQFWLLRRGPILWGKSEWANSESEAMCRDLSKEKNMISCAHITFNKSFV